MDMEKLRLIAEALRHSMPKSNYPEALERHQKALDAADGLLRGPTPDAPELTPEEQETFWQIMADEASDMSTRDVVELMAEGMTNAEKREGIAQLDAE